MRYVKTIGNLILPSILFYGIYRIAGILPAVLLSLGINLILLSIDIIKKRPIANTQILGILGGVFSALAVWGGGNEKWTFVPALLQNIIMTGFFILLTIRKKSVLKFICKDFQIKTIESMQDDKLQPLNLLWLAFFCLKIFVKIAGLVLLDYDKLYLLTFLMGDPALLLVVLFTVLIIKKNIK